MVLARWGHSEMIEATREHLPGFSPEVFTDRSVNAVLNKVASMFVIVDMQTARTLNGNTEENDRL